MKIFIYISVAILFIQSSFSQARYTFIDFKDAQKPGVQAEYGYPEKTVSDAIDNKMQKLGYKSRDYKGYAMYKGVILPELGNQPYDLYFSVDKKSKKEKDNSVVNMLISTGNENFVSDTSNSTVINNAKSFLNNLTPAVAAYDLQQQVDAQDQALKKAEKKYKTLQDDADDLQKRKKKIEQQIEDNIKAQKDQQAEVEKQRQLLDALKARQK